MINKNSVNQIITPTSDITNNWLLPDGVHDVLFADADKQQYLRHQLISQLASRGYQLVTPPLIEFTESLLGNASEDLKRQTFKLIDQVTGRLMGLRADTTPQILRIDANYGAKGDGKFGSVARYCYAGHTIHTLPKGLFGLRTPLQLGAEIFGTDELSADFEMLDVVYALLNGLKLKSKIHLDLGHVAIFRRLCEIAVLSDDSIEKVMQLYANKALPELKEVCSNIVMGDDFYQLAQLGHDIALLSKGLSAEACQDRIINNAINELTQLQAYLKSQGVEQVSLDVSELSGYHYHTGMMFSIYMHNASQPIVRGGRFDGGAQSNTRPAIGFSMDITRLFPNFDMKADPIVLVDYSDTLTVDESGYQAMLSKVDELRSNNYRVVVPLNIDDKPNCTTHRLHYIDNEWQLLQV